MYVYTLGVLFLLFLSSLLLSSSTRIYHKYHTKYFEVRIMGGVSLSNLLAKPLPRLQVSSLIPPPPAFHSFRTEGSGFPLLVCVVVAIPGMCRFCRRVPLRLLHGSMLFTSIYYSSTWYTWYYSGSMLCTSILQQQYTCCVRALRQQYRPPSHRKPESRCFG